MLSPARTPRPAAIVAREVEFLAQEAAVARHDEDRGALHLAAREDQGAVADPRRLHRDDGALAGEESPAAMAIPSSSRAQTAVEIEGSASHREVSGPITLSGT